MYHFPEIQPDSAKHEIVAMLCAHLQRQGFTIAQVDDTRPWGAFLRVVDEQADKFIEAYYADVYVPPLAREGERSPKILLVAPHLRLSWQYHDRRSELWRAVSGDVGVYISRTDQQPDEMRTLHLGETIELSQGTRHRLVGLDTWGAVAEIWIHMEPQNPSNEDDIYRLQDDYERS